MNDPNQLAFNCVNVAKTVQAINGPLTILNDLNLSASVGASLAIIGQSGSGKTTLLSLLAGLDSPSSGKIQLFDQSIESLNEDERARIRNQYIGFVFQAFHLLPGFTSVENVMLPLELNNVSDAESRASELLARVGMSHRLHHYPATLSGGEQQRVALARAFIAQPPLLFADEPTGNLDTETGETVIDLLFSLNKEFNTTLVLVTHDEHLSERCELKYRLVNGCLAQA